MKKAIGNETRFFLLLFGILGVPSICNTHVLTHARTRTHTHERMHARTHTHIQITYTPTRDNELFVKNRQQASGKL